MNTDSRRDESIDTLLRRNAQGRAAGDPTGSCVDAEALAAWAEDRLPRAEAAAIDAHLADCASCQELLAVFARTEPPAAAPAGSRTWWKPAWAVPIAAAATAAAIWVAAPDERGVDDFDRTIAPTLEERDARFGAAPSSAAPSNAVPSNTPAATPAPSEPAPSEPAQPGPAAHAPAPLARREAPASPPSAPSPPRADAAADSAFGDRAKAQTEAAPARQAASPPQTVSPDPLVRWRIEPPRRLERSTDGGRTWTPVTLPEPVEPVAVAAPAPSTAIVTAADGRQFRTDDLGKTWTAVQP